MPATDEVRFLDVQSTIRTFEFNCNDTGMVTDVIIIEGGKTLSIDEKLHTA